MKRTSNPLSLVATTAVYFLGRNRMRASSDGFSASGQG